MSTQCVLKLQKDDESIISIDTLLLALLSEPISVSLSLKVQFKIPKSISNIAKTIKILILDFSL